MNLGGLAGLSGVYSGYQEAEGQDLRNRLLRVQGSKGQYDLDTQQGADAALAKALPNILGGVPGVAGLAGFGGLQEGPPQQGTQIAPQQQGPISAAPMPPAQASTIPSGLPPSPYGQQPGLGFSGGAGVGDRGGFGLQRPGFPQVQQDLGDPSAQNRAMYGPLADAAGQRAQALGQPNMAAIPSQQPFAQRPQPAPQAPPPQQMPFTPQQQPQGMPQGQPMGGMQPPQMMDWRGAFQSIVKSNPGAPPGAVIGAMDKLVQLMNPIERAQWAEQRNMLTMALGMANLGERRREADMRDTRSQENLQERKRQFEIGRQPTFSGQALDVAAENYFKSGKLPPNLGRGIQGSANTEAIIDRAAQLHPDVPIDQWASQQQAFASRAAGLRTLENRAANLRLAAAETNRLIPRVEELSNIVNRTDYPDINKIILAADSKSGDPNVIRLGIALKSARYVYARILKPVGVLNKGDMDEAQGILQEAWSKGQINAALDQMRVELGSAEQGLSDVEQSYGMPATGGGGAPQAPGQPPSQPQGGTVIKYDAQGNRVQQ